MAKKKSNPPISATERTPLESVDSVRPSSLPPELGSIDVSWDDDTRSLRGLDLLPDSDLDMDLDAGDRTTAIPEIPMAELVAASMAAAEKKEHASLGDSSPPTVPNVPIPDETPTADYSTSRREPIENPGVTRPAPARQQDELFGSYNASEPPADSHPPGAFKRPLSTSPPLSTRSMAGPVGPPSAAKQGAVVDDRLSVAPPTTRSENDAVRQRMKDLYATGDFSGALDLAETLLVADSGDLEAQRFSTSCRDVLTQMFQSRIGQLDQVVEVVRSPEELRWLTLDHRAGFLLSLIDGAITVEELLDIAGMAKLESLRILSLLIEQRVIQLVQR